MFYTLIEHSPTLDITINTQLWLSCRCCIRTIREHIRLYIFGFIVYINNKNINIKKVTQCDKNRANVMLVLLHMTMELSNLRKKNKVTTICDKRTVKCDTGTVECDNRTVKYEEKKKKETIECDKRTVTCDVRTAQCEDEIVKCEKRTVTCDVGTAQCEDGTVKCEKKVREPLNMTKELSHVMLELHNVKMKSSNVRKK